MGDWLPGVFVTGTDTGVGKTVVAGALARALRERGIDAAVMKPVQTGAIREGEELVAPDARYLVRASGVDDPPEWVCPVRLEPPLAPSVAAELEGRAICLGAVTEAYRRLRERRAWVVAEGAGGLLVPIRDGYTMADLARDLRLPLLVVARPSLGTINHSLLTVRCARAEGLPVIGIVIANYPADPGLAERTSPPVIERLAGVPVLGLVPHDPGVDTEAGRPAPLHRALDEAGITERVIRAVARIAG